MIYQEVSSLFGTVYGSGLTIERESTAFRLDVRL
jgi:hypothetical protein